MFENGTSSQNSDSRLATDGGENRPYRSAKFLREQYVERRKSSNEIADSCDVSPSTVRRWLDRHDIDRTPRYKQRDWLYEQYVTEGRYQEAIAEECGVAKTTICHWLARHEITDGGSLQRAECAECGDAFRYYPSVRDGAFCSTRCANKQRRRQVEVICPFCDEPFERRESLDTQYCSMECWGQDQRTGADYRRYYSTYWLAQREQVLERDGYECAICRISDGSHRDRFGRGLEVHHIVPVRMFAAWDKPPKDAHSIGNLITLCRTHHPDAPGRTVEPDEKWSEPSKIALKERIK
ncbi:HNH endonuclease [Halorientalis marina]|jgi:5-methylcytosine-specific restriction endonuclease McrA|uniref:HNH endonuclease n=1 Tax=Halorientalis marina TaxID=2931976 RepID=UPI001FF27BCD|nr:HNH endonuclease [Halorientalis marina]